jgi:hypothetical protein
MPATNDLQAGWDASAGVLDAGNASVQYTSPAASDLAAGWDNSLAAVDGGNSTSTFSSMFDGGSA